MSSSSSYVVPGTTGSAVTTMPSTSSTRRPSRDATDEGTGAPAAARVWAVVADLATASA